MASTIKLKNGSGAPTSGQLVQGEPALDLTNKRLYTENASGTVIEVGTNPAAEITANGGIALPDNQKATFGASDDLQIYHDVSNSVIKDAGTGDLVIMANNLLINNAASSQQMIGAADGGAVTLFNAGNLKLSTTSTGIDVTGTVTADGLTVDGILEVASTSPQFKLTDTDVTGFSRILGSSGNIYLDADPTNENANSQVYIRIDGKNTALFDDTGDISFYEDTGTTAKFFWDASAESLGIGTTSPTAKLTSAGLTGTTIIQALGADTDGFADVEIKSTGTAGASRLFFSDTAAQSGVIRYSHGTNSMEFSTNGSQRARIDASGNVGIGTTSPAAKLEIGGAGEGIILASPDGTRYKITVANGGTLTVTAV